MADGQLPTQSQMANGNLKVPDLKVCVQNVKLFFTQTLELQKISKLQKIFSKDIFFWKNVFPDNFFSKNFSLLYKRDMYAFA